MKKQMIILIGLIVFLMSPFISEAQIWKDMGKKIEKKVEQQADRRLERKIDKTIDKGFDKIEEATEVKNKEKKEKTKNNKKSSTKEESDENSTDDDDSVDFSKVFEQLGKEPAGGENSSFDASSILKSMGFGGSEAPPPAKTYTFNLGVDYEITTDNQEPIMFIMKLSDNDYMGMSPPMGQEAFMIMQNGFTYTFLKDQMKYMVVDMNEMMEKAVAKAEETEPDSQVGFKKIGTETILGYKCDIYQITTEEGVTKMSIANGIPIEGFLGNLSAMAKNAKIPKNAPGSGLPLKIETKNNEGDIFVMLAKKVDKQKFEFKASEYKSLFEN